MYIEYSINENQAEDIAEAMLTEHDGYYAVYPTSVERVENPSRLLALRVDIYWPLAGHKAVYGADIWLRSSGTWIAVTKDKIICSGRRHSLMEILKKFDAKDIVQGAKVLEVKSQEPDRPLFS